MENTIELNCDSVLTVKDLQKILCIGRTLAYQLLENKTIKSVKVGKTLRIPKVCVEEYLSKAVGQNEES